MLRGLEIFDGSMAKSVARRRFLWRVAGLSLLAVGSWLVFVAAGWFAWIVDFDRRPLDRVLTALAFALLACGCGIEGVRLLRRNRKSAANLRLHRWSVGCWVAAAGAASPVYACVWLPMVWARRQKDRLPPTPPDGVEAESLSQ